MNTPLQLTLIRLVASPCILPLLLVFLLPYNYLAINIVLGILFFSLSITDFFDGYLARKYNQITRVGELLDPIADKFLLYATLIALVVVKKMFFYWSILLIGREFFIMGLRIVALEHNAKIAVSWLGKIKTAVLTIMIGWIIINPYQSLALENAPYANGGELGLLIAGLLFSLGSAYQYYRSFRQQIPCLFE